MKFRKMIDVTIVTISHKTQNMSFSHVSRSFEAVIAAPSPRERRKVHNTSPMDRPIALYSFAGSIPAIT